MQTQWERMGFGLAEAQAIGSARGKPWVQPMPEGLDPDAYRAEAQRILDGQFRLFGEDLYLGFPPRWNRNPKSGIDVPRHFGKALDYRDGTRFGDAKFLWEPNRHMELLALSQAWQLTKDSRFAAGARELVESWLLQCPYPLGPNWCSTLEVALRLANWAVSWHILGGDDAPVFASEEGLRFRNAWLASVRQHCHFVRRNLSGYSSANNHLLGELFGLFLGATTWPCWSESAEWQSYARSEFEHQALLQNAADGVNKEQAIWYQHEVADMMLMAGLTARANGDDFSTAFWERWQRMLEFVASCMDVGGNVPAIGDSDDAVIVRLGVPAGVSAFRSMLASGSVLFGRDDFKFKARVFDEKSRWLLGDRGAAQFNALEIGAAASIVRQVFPLGGYYVLGGDFNTAHEVRIVADAGPLGFLSIAAHGHADALSFTLSAAGQPVLIDPGTYCYHTQPEWRAYFRGTAAHNTVRIDGVDQSVSAGNFLWSRHAHPLDVHFNCAIEEQRLAAAHDGYRRLRDPVTHRREWVYRATERALLVRDAIECTQEHELEMLWHFSPSCVVVLNAQRATVSCGPVTVEMQLPDDLEAAVVRGADGVRAGWVSSQFGQRASSSTIVTRGRVGKNWCGETSIRVSIRLLGDPELWSPKNS
jgi:Heparinase II/III-like protein/Heparinase II/III N-terminus